MKQLSSSNQTPSLHPRSKNHPGSQVGVSGHRFVAGVPAELQEPQLGQQSDLRALPHYPVQAPLTDEIFPQCFFRDGLMERILLFC